MIDRFLRNAIFVKINWTETLANKVWRMYEYSTDVQNIWLHRLSDWRSIRRTTSKRRASPNPNSCFSITHYKGLFEGLCATANSNFNDKTSKSFGPQCGKITIQIIESMLTLFDVTFCFHGPLGCSPCF